MQNPLYTIKRYYFLATKVKKAEKIEVENFCRQRGITVSDLIRLAVTNEMTSIKEAERIQKINHRGAVA